MRRVMMMMLVVGMALGAGGCSSFFQDTSPEKPWTPARWDEEKVANQERLAGVDAKEGVVTTGLLVLPRAIGTGVENTWNWARGNTPSAWAKDLFGKVPDKRREAIFKFAARKYGRQEPYIKYYRHMAETDEDFTVRAAAIRALNWSRDKESTPIFTKALEDKAELVRLEAAKALANVPDEKAVGALIKHLGSAEEGRDVRIASADALRNFHTSQVAQALIRVLLDRDYGVSWQARQSLNLMTGEDYRYDQSAWLAYLTGPAKPFG